MRLVKIDSALVAANEENYNSYFHTEAEAPGESIPSEVPQSFKRWLPLIAKSQNISLEQIQITNITSKQARFILEAAQSSLHTREPNRLYAEELAELALSFNTLNFTLKGLFLRLDACSAKDGVRGISPLRTAEEIVLRITTSHRATNSILRCLESGDEAFELFFLPFNEHMRTENEYRVFCAPPEGKITAVSQYRWHKPNFFSARPADEISRAMERIMNGAQEVHGNILDEVKGGNGGEMDKLLLQQGFTFDVMFDEESEECKLIELNSFGVRSGCGSCLFHWLRDWDALYGRPKDGGGEVEIEFRISV
ncbi:uncharacterized protein LY89DRAFT_681045 [Mollisia scopiformis]|uniref:Cell division cycle protein 123 n=1 Tax=Mollisia scopiformis TaxID=149040 RepID=A0A194XN66_MOLSC|nr:uncharacterized protein LY89DRAFT_681045 [Mollisia scopiformis]KUJ21581.1 hypothetical protein LY89DRAFT_681045 [Mollisia scopiformis]